MFRKPINAKLEWIIININMSDIGFQIELAINCRNLKDKDTFTKSDPTVLVYLKRFLGDRIEDNWYLIG